ncbi:MAG TPA: glycosyltransferase [Flavobacteriaceae bacterium]|nr:glycosyltransferase [Flavobacteriaceae bacterium]MCB9213485.1 glycosyltransferase [Alteromonas sp.]HPF12212.1 glycosyltransferase [Flavobacteriaceae bacterium]HQU22001.1 glycosyltransferase [Flavobacteriaceae bacterium]HQU65900.1 glycosyltransferase [Flavobacteriaceae bacterium]
MKIIRLTTFLDYGGIETKMANLSVAEDTNNEWIFCALGKGGGASKTIAQQNKRVCCFERKHKIPSLGTIAVLYRFFKKEKPQIVHTAGAEANFHGIIAARLAGVPKIISEEIGIPAHSTLAKLLFSWIYRISNFVVGESNTVVEFLKENYKLPEAKTKVIHNFVLFPKLEAFRNDLFPKDRVNLVSLSRLEAVKNLEGVLHAVQLLVNESYPIHYHIVGSGTSEASLKKMVHDLAITEHVTFWGFQEKPFPFLRSAEVFILNSFSEGFSNSLLEAMYAGTPSLSTQVGAANEILEDGKNGWVIPVNDGMALYEKLKELLILDKPRLQQIGLEGQKTVLENYSLQGHLEKLMELYRK